MVLEGYDKKLIRRSLKDSAAAAEQLIDKRPQLKLSDEIHQWSKVKHCGIKRVNITPSQGCSSTEKW
jgi:hypothetical protein